VILRDSNVFFVMGCLKDFMGWDSNGIFRKWILMVCSCDFHGILISNGFFRNF
jgi:hypothetical protein